MASPALTQRRVSDPQHPLNSTVMYTSANEEDQRASAGRILTALAATLALLGVAWLCQAAGAVAVGANHPVGDPGFVHTSLHALHDQIQQNLHCMTHVLAVHSARLEVRDTAKRPKIKWIRAQTTFDTFNLVLKVKHIIIHYHDLRRIFLTECLFTLSTNSPPWWQRLFTLTPPTNVWLGPSGADGKMCVVLIFTRSTGVRIRLLTNFFSPFSNFKSHQKSIYFQ